jgi:ABC-type transporter MlaC component
MSWIARITFMLLMALHGAVHAANGMTPDATVQATIDDILGVMKTTLDKRELRRQAEIKVLPKFDFRGMTKLAVGRPWRAEQHRPEGHRQPDGDGAPGVRGG